MKRKSKTVELQTSSALSGESRIILEDSLVADGVGRQSTRASDNLWLDCVRL